LNSLRRGLRPLYRKVRSHVAAARILRDQRSRGAPSLPLPPAQSAFAAGAWRKIGGDGIGWPADQFYKVRSLAFGGGTLFASLTGPTQEGPRGEVWAFADDVWRRIGGSERNSWPAEPAFVDQLTLHRGTLYAGAAQRLWCYDGHRWADAAGPLPVTDRAGPYAFADLDQRLAVSFWGDPAVSVFDGITCKRLPDPEDGWGANARTVYCLAVFQGALCAGTGTGRLSGSAACVYRWDGGKWEKIGGAGIRGSWTQEGVPFVLSLTAFGEQLIATLSRPAGTPAAASNVWAFDGTEWRPVGGGNTPAIMADSSIMNDAKVFNGHLVVATGDSSKRNVRIWTLDAEQNWHDVSGGALNGPVNDRPGGYWVYSLCIGDDHLYAGTAGHQGGARVFRWTPRA
jgi:hypothetical protein